MKNFNLFVKNFVFMSGEKIKPNIDVGLCKSSYHLLPVGSILQNISGLAVERSANGLEC